MGIFFCFLSLALISKPGCDDQTFVPTLFSSANDARDSWQVNAETKGRHLETSS